MNLNLKFPEILFPYAPGEDDISVMWLLPYIPERPFAVSVPMPMAISAQMEKGAEIQLQIDGRNFYLLPLSAARKNEPELAVAKAAAGLVKQGWNRIAISMLEGNGADLQLLAGYATDSCRQHFSMKTKKRSEVMDSVIHLVTGKSSPEVEAAIQRGVAMGKARAFMRTIIDMPGNVATPRGITHYTQEFIKEQGLEDVILFKAATRTDESVARMGAFLGVAKGSEQEPVFLELGYGMAGFEKVTVANVNLVGKGVTFDSGGISIKPSNNLHHMKGDMGGAAAAIAAVLYAAMAKLPLKLRAFTPLCENMPSHNALKPGDVVTAYDGTTIEVIDTDAEGRLVLADALAYANEFPAELTLNMATLTGACKMALGQAYAGLFSDNDELCSEFTAAGRAGKDKAWRLPMTDDYAYMLLSDIADVSHLDRTKGGGTINGAYFLKHFVKQKDRWVHLDIANVSAEQASATGRPMALLAKLLDKRAGV